MGIKLAFTEWSNVLNIMKTGVFPLSSGVTFATPLALLQHHYLIVFFFYGLQGKKRQELYTHYDFSMALEIC